MIESHYAQRAPVSAGSAPRAPQTVVWDGWALRVPGDRAARLGRVVLAWVVLAWVVGLTGACSAPALPPDYGRAERLEREGSIEEALAVYQEAARTCTKRRQDCAVTRMRVGQMQARLGREAEAVETFLALERQEGRGLKEGARAMGRAAALLAKRGQVERARALWWHLVDHYPETLAADDALSRIVLWYRDRKQLRELVPKLRQRYLRLRQQDIGDNLLWEAGQILEEGSKQDQDLAVRLYQQIIRDYPEGGLRDNAWMAAAAVRRRQGKFMEAILLYKELLDTREDAFGGASYHSEFLDDAQLAIGKIWLLDLGRPDRAVRAFRALVRGLVTSVLRDDAQLWIALAEVERDREDRAREAFARLVKDFPESRFVREEEPLRTWMALRRAARAGDGREACRQWSLLQASHPFSWLVRRAPRPKPWLDCDKGSAEAGPADPRPGAATGVGEASP